MSKRITLNFLANDANRHQLKAYLRRMNVETYREESDNDLREIAVAYFERNLPEETPELQSYDYDYGYEYGMRP